MGTKFILRLIQFRKENLFWSHILTLSHSELRPPINSHFYQSLICIYVALFYVPWTGRSFTIVKPTTKFTIGERTKLYVRLSLTFKFPLSHSLTMIINLFIHSAAQLHLHPTTIGHYVISESMIPWTLGYGLRWQKKGVEIIRSIGLMRHLCRYPNLLGLRRWFCLFYSVHCYFLTTFSLCTVLQDLVAVPVNREDCTNGGRFNDSEPSLPGTSSSCEFCYS